MAFTATNKLPGVYIDEIDVPGPIAGVATSVLAVVGPARMGPIDTPTLVTNPTQFREAFGGHFTAPVFYASHAVHGFFENGGSSCYFVRASSGARSSLDLLDANGNVTLVVTARELDVQGNPIDGDSIEVEVVHVHLATTNASRGDSTVASGGAAGSTVLAVAVGDGGEFAAGDVILLDDGGGTTELATVASLSGDDLTLTTPLTNTFGVGAAIRVADLAVNRTSFRLEDSTGIEPGSYVTISQGAISDGFVVTQVDRTNHVVSLDHGLPNPLAMTGPNQVQVQSQEFTLNLAVPDPALQNLAMDPRHPRFFGSVLRTTPSKFVQLALADDPPNPSVPPTNLPAPLPATNLAGGAPDDPANLALAEYQRAIDVLERIDAVTMLVIPEATTIAGLQGAMITHCEKMQDRFAILDPQRGATPTNGIRTQRGALNSDRGYAALYYPWIWISNPDPAVRNLPPEQGRLLIPPSGHIAGVFARTDNAKGVHKAPANEQIRGILDLERTLNDTESGQLNELSVNVLRRVPNRGFRVWGARTLTTSTQWRYVNVRRLLLFIEESIQEGTEFAVFEPNNRSLWETVKRQVVEFLTTVWATGAFVGATPETSFRVRVDEELNPPGQIALGILTFEVIVYPAPPAEFIVFRVIQEPGGPRLEEA